MARKKKEKRNAIHITALPKFALAMIAACSLVEGGIILIMCYFSIMFLPLAIVCFWLTYICLSELKRRKEELQKTEICTKGEA